MKIVYATNKFSELKPGDIFTVREKSETLLMKIHNCKENEGPRNTIRLHDGTLWHTGADDDVYPVSCYLVRS